MTTLGITPGCPAGIGPEVLVRAIVDAVLPARTELVFFASAAQLLEGARRARVPARLEASERRDGSAAGSCVRLGRGARARTVRCVVARQDDRGAEVRPGQVDADALASQRDALVRACDAGLRGELHAIVTGPVRKSALVIDGVAWPGQTEVVHRALGIDDHPPLMVFAGGPFLLGLATVHLPLSGVCRALTPQLLDVALARLGDAAVRLCRARAPRLLVLGVNPHAGEGGLLGREELEVVAPTVARARQRGAQVEGPVPADGFFADVARGGRRLPHAVLAMHHDQGLAPYKLLAGGEGINITWGLRVPRTSPDHGTADALAGRGRASSASMQRALELAADLGHRRRRGRRGG